MWDIEKQVDTVVALGVGTRCDETGDETVVAPILERLGYKLQRAKTNTGLGRVMNVMKTEPADVEEREMTNTLHRFGTPQSFQDDYVIFAIASRGKNDQGALEKLREFLRLARQFGPVNLGDARNGGALRPCKNHEPAVALGP